ncbi:MAG: DUF4249 domain-containing protein [Cyclobacteriaceae bacterium]|nr:DUF4249 domain-containing protein [Cyclobacteriaceae bacterium]
MKRSFFLFLISLSACIDPYTHPEIAESIPLLVVDGFINPSETSKISLSYSQNLNLARFSGPAYEAGAEVWIEDEQGNKFSLPGDNLGNYYLAPNSINTSTPTFRLKIRLADQKEYESEFVPVLVSPAIDSVTWGLTNTREVEVKVSTHSLNNESGYYRWTFDETWEYFTPFHSSLVLNPSTLRPDMREDNLSRCWRKDYSTNISIESTARFSENKVSEFAIHRIKLHSERVRTKYSMLVKQQALTADAYNYWKQVKKTNEDLGTIFGPLPTEVIGNIRSISNPGERVIGFFSVSSISTKRIFITTQELPRPSQLYETPYGSCELRQVAAGNVSQITPGIYLLIDPIYAEGSELIVAYTYSSRYCADCSLSGGTLVQPEYWQ